MSSLLPNLIGLFVNVFLTDSLVTHTPTGSTYSSVMNLKTSAVFCLLFFIMCSARDILTV